MGPLLILLIIAIVSIVVVRVGAMALMITGLSSDTASFQSYSAFFGVGFTTSEAEMVVNHPVRRRIIRDLILAGNLGLTSGLATVVVTFSGASDSAHAMTLLGVLIGGALTFALLVKIGFIRRILDSTIRVALQKSSLVHALDYELLLRVRDGFCVSEIDLLSENPLADQTLRESRPADRGVLILGIQKGNGEYVGAPGPEDRLEAGDVVMVYGSESDVKKISQASSSEDPD